MKADQCPPFPSNSTSGARYRLSIDYAVVSSYANGIPWSIQIGPTIFLSGTGAAVGWTTSSSIFTCGPSVSTNTLTIKVAANNSRAGALQVDNIFLNQMTT